MPKRYPSEFRRRAVALVEGGRTVRQVALDLEIGEQTIYNWLRQHRIDTGQIPGTHSVESAELSSARRRINELEKELDATRRANELLKESTSPKGDSRPSR